MGDSVGKGAETGRGGPPGGGGATIPGPPMGGSEEGGGGGLTKLTLFSVESKGT